MDLENEHVVYLEFSDEGQPYSAITHEETGRGYIAVSHYDVDISKRYGLLYHLSGCGGSTDTIKLRQPVQQNKDGSLSPMEIIYWVAPGITVTGLTVYKRLDKLPEPYSLETMFDGLHAINCEYGILWCSRCKDFLPDRVEDYCKHIWYCHKCDAPSIPGERCRHKRQ